MDLVTVFATLNAGEADFVKSQLEAAGFDAIVADQNAIYALTPPVAARGIRVQVPDSQAADARALIEATVASKSESSAVDET